MKNDKIYLAPECLGKSIELVAVTPDMYADGVKQAEPVGYTYEVLLRDHRADKLKVHVSGAKQMDDPISGEGIMVRFDELRVRPYVNRVTGQLAYSATATSIKPAAGTDAPAQNRKT